MKGTTMDHKVFGNLKYKDEGRVGEATLPVFAAVGQRPEPQPPSHEEQIKLAKQALENVDQRMKNLLGKSRLKSLFQPFTKRLVKDVAKDIAKLEAEGEDPDWPNCGIKNWRTRPPSGLPKLSGSQAARSQFTSWIRRKRVRALSKKPHSGASWPSQTGCSR